MKFLDENFALYKRVNSSGSFITEEHVTKLTLTDKNVRIRKCPYVKRIPDVRLMEMFHTDIILARDNLIFQILKNEKFNFPSFQNFSESFKIFAKIFRNLIMPLIGSWVLFIDISKIHSNHGQDKLHHVHPLKKRVYTYDCTLIRQNIV